MTIAYFLHVDGPSGQHESLHDWADKVFGPALRSGGISRNIEAYSPQTVDDPYLGSETGKLLIVEANFDTQQQLESTLAHTQVAGALAAIPAGRDAQLTAEAFTVRQFPLLDGSIPPRQAPVSFVVRYYRPIEEEEAFNNHYFAHHPPIMVHFPRIRNILCYIPVEYRDANQVASTNSFLGNEIVFDSVEDLNTALTSEARHELREDYYSFPPHNGETSHHAMQRRALK
jgi:uncharacterized protein (TIGR02118 family)